MPDALAAHGVQTDDRLGEQVVPLAVAAVVIVARRSHREIDKTALLVQSDGRPDVGVAGLAPGFVFPGLVTVLALLGDEIEAPDQLAGLRNKYLDVSRGILIVYEKVPDSVSQDDQVLVDDRRGGLRVMEPVGVPEEALGEIDLAALPECRNGLPGHSVDGDETPAAVEEEAPPLSVEPRGDPAVHVAHSVRRLAPLDRPGVVFPDLLPRLRVERDDAVVGRAQVHDPVDDQRSRLEVARSDTVSRNGKPRTGDGRLPGLPHRPDLELRDVPPVDLIEHRVLLRPGVTAPVGPITLVELLRFPAPGVHRESQDQNAR